MLGPRGGASALGLRGKLQALMAGAWTAASGRSRPEPVTRTVLPMRSPDPPTIPRRRPVAEIAGWHTRLASHILLCGMSQCAGDDCSFEDAAFRRRGFYADHYA